MYILIHYPKKSGVIVYDHSHQVHVLYVYLKSYVTNNHDNIFEPARQAATIAKHHALPIAPRHSLAIIFMYM